MTNDDRLIVIESHLRDALFLIGSAARWGQILDDQLVDWTLRELRFGCNALRAAVLAAYRLKLRAEVPDKTRHIRAKRQVTRTRRASPAPTPDARTARTARGTRTR